MAKITLDTITSGFQSTSQVNNNNADIATNLNDKVLYRDNPTGEPNQMVNLLDMNSNQIINLPAPSSPTSPLRFLDLPGTIEVTVETTVSFDTVAEMVASLVLSIGDTVHTFGYTTLGDGGANSYKIVAGATGTDDGGSFLNLVTGLQAQATFDLDNINVKQFGAVGNGTTDDTAAIQACIDFVRDDRGGIVVVPAGTYLISSTLTISDWYGSAAMTLQGEGSGPWNKDGIITTDTHTSLFVVTADSFDLFKITSTSQTIIRNISIRDNFSGTRTSGDAIFLERFGDGLISDDGNVTGVLIENIGIKGFFNAIRAIRLQTSTIRQMFIEDCIQDGIKLESTSVGGGTSVTLENNLVKECGRDNYSINGMSYSSLENCASDSAGRHSYFMDGVTNGRNNNGITFSGTGSEGATTDGIHFTSGNPGMVINAGLYSGSGNSNIFTESLGITILGSKNQLAGAFGIETAGNGTVTCMGIDFAANTTADVSNESKVYLLNTSLSDAFLLGHTQGTGASSSDLVMKNTGFLRSLNNAGTTSNNYFIRSSSTDGWVFSTPVTSSSYSFGWAGTTRMELEEINGAFVLRMLGEVSVVPGNPAANQGRMFLQDNGGGKTQLMIRFGTGAAQIIATEP